MAGGGLQKDGRKTNGIEEMNGEIGEGEGRGVVRREGKDIIKLCPLPHPFLKFLDLSVIFWSVNCCDV